MTDDVTTDDNGFPVHRSTNRHPITGDQDGARMSPGDRYRIECLEHDLGYIICGRKNPDTGGYCPEPPAEGAKRCSKHLNGMPDDVNKCVKNVKYAMGKLTFFHCRACDDRGCPHFTIDPYTDECYFEREIFETVMKEGRDMGLDKSAVTNQMLVTLAWNMVNNFRGEHHIIRDGMVVEDVANVLAIKEGQDTVDVQVYYNKREHPVLKVLPKIQSQILNLARELEMTPREKSRKETDDKLADNGSAIFDLLAEAHRRRQEGKK